VQEDALVLPQSEAVAASPAHVLHSLEQQTIINPPYVIAVVLRAQLNPIPIPAQT
jgi:hypothetical protein